MKKKKKGFTIVELVIVIAVIAILAAVLIPTFSAVIKNANNSADLQLVNNLNIVAATHRATGNSNEFDSADNIRSMLKEEGIAPESLATKNKDAIIVYNTEINKFERCTLSSDKLVAFADESEESSLIVGYYLEEIFEYNLPEYKIIVSTRGNDLVEAIYALHNLPYDVDGDYIDKQLKNIKDDAIKDKLKFILEDTVFITDKNGDAEGTERAVSITFDDKGKATVSDGAEGKTRIIFHEHEQDVNLNDSKFADTKDSLVAIIPNYVKAVYGDAGNMFLAGNTDAFGVDDISEDTIISVGYARYLVLNSDKERSSKLSLDDDLVLHLSDSTDKRVSWTSFEDQLRTMIAEAIEEESLTKDGITIFSMDDGKYYYGDKPEDENGIVYVSGGDYVNGGTYKLKAQANGKDIYGQGNKALIVKFRTVQIDTSISYNDHAEWYTIEEALAIAGTTKDGINYGTTVVVAGSTTTYDYQNAIKGKADAVVTAFTALEDSITGYSSEGRIIKSGVVLLLPFDGISSVNRTITASDRASNANYQGQVIGNVDYNKVELVVPAGMTLTNSGTINIGGITNGGAPTDGSGAGHTAGRYAQITLGAGAIIKSYGNINAYGFIVEEIAHNGAEVNMHSGTLLMPFVITEHRGGAIIKYLVTNSTLSNKVNMYVLPFNRFYMQNVTAVLKVYDEASVHGWMNLYIEGDRTTTVNFIGNAGDYFFQLLSSSYVEWKYDIATKIINIDTYGDININPLQVNLAGKASGVSFNFDISTDGIFAPLSWHYNLTFKPIGEGIATVKSNQAVKILPGAVMRVAKGVTLDIGKIIVYDADWVDNGCANEDHYPTDKGNGKLIVNGRLKVNEIGGCVEMGEDDAFLTVTGSVNVTSKEVDIANYTIIKTLKSVDYKEYQKELTDTNGNKLSVGIYISQGGKWIKV